MRALVKVGVVAAGYAGAGLVALVVVSVYAVATSRPDRQTYGAMYAFGDFVLFLVVFGIAAVPATGAALYFLRPYRVVWRGLAVAALTLAATGLAACAVDLLAVRAAGAASAFHAWSALAVLRTFAAPPLALVFLLGGLFAPTLGFRVALLAAALLEAAAFVCVALRLVQLR